MLTKKTSQSILRLNGFTDKFWYQYKTARRKRRITVLPEMINFSLILVRIPALASPPRGRCGRPGPGGPAVEVGGH